jgi:hypothetical protein
MNFQKRGPALLGKPLGERLMFGGLIYSTETCSLSWNTRTVLIYGRFRTGLLYGQ